MTKLSIVIAMYNIEEYIASCLQSCLNQEGVSPIDYEVIVVNDGATDNSLQVAEATLKGVSNARIVTRRNGGLSEARNTGLLESNGDYVWFVDGDDMIDKNAISNLLKYISQSKADIYLCNCSTYDGERILKSSHFPSDYSGMSGRQIHNEFRQILPMMAWLSICRRDFLIQNQLKFYPRILHEDLEFSIRAHHLAQSIVCVEEALYLYRVGRIGSIMQQNSRDNSKSIKSYFTILESWKAFFSAISEVNTPFYRDLCAIWASLFFRLMYSGKQDIPTKKQIKERYLNCVMLLLKGELRKKILGIGILLLPDFLLRKFLGNNEVVYI